jgi:hypothetical protein
MKKFLASLSDQFLPDVHTELLCHISFVNEGHGA